MSGLVGVNLAVLGVLPVFLLFCIIFLMVRATPSPTNFHGHHSQPARSPSFSTRRTRSSLPDEESGLLTPASSYSTFAGFDCAHPAAIVSSSVSEASPSVDTAATSVREIVTAAKPDFPKKPLRRDCTNDHITHVRLFGCQGSGGETWLGRGAESKELVVVKEIPDRADDWAYPGEYRMLVDILKCESHPNVNKILGFAAHRDYTELFYEFANAGDLYSFTKCYPGAKQGIRDVHPMMINHFIASLGDALGYLHLSLPAHGGNPAVEPHAPIIHGDIKLENIFLRYPGTNKYGLPDIVLGDFGLSVFAAESYGPFGTPGYMDPELDMRMKLFEVDDPATLEMDHTRVVNFSTDMYAFGVSLFRLGTTDWYIKELEYVPLDLVGAIRESSFSYPGMERAAEIMVDALERRTEDRLTIKELYNEVPYFRRQVRKMYEVGQRLHPGAIPTEPLVFPPANRPGPHRSMHKVQAPASTPATLGSWTRRSITAVKSFDVSDTTFQVDFSAFFNADESQAHPGVYQPQHHVCQGRWSESSAGSVQEM